ncbi:hypothetical protein M1N16_06365 [Nitrospinaceae bacterium]|nr:hypothetical protein [Nitrospinaceae bacterium]
MLMRRVFYYLGILVCLFFVSSCAGVGALVTITAFGIEGYEEVRVHRPDLKLEPISDHLNRIRLPNIPFLSKKSSDQNNTKTKPSGALSTFGFNCSNLDDEKKQSKCFDDFSIALAQEEEEYNKQKGAVTTRKKENLTTLQKVAKTLKVLRAKAVKKPSFPQNKEIKKKKKPTTPPSLAASFIQNWARAWIKKDIPTYLSFYSKEFKGSKNHRGAWEASRQRAFKNNKNISIKLSNIQTSQKKINRVEVNFTQEYKSDGYADTGIKELLVEKKDTGWKIIKETWMIAGASAKDKSSTDRLEQVKDKLAGWLKAWEHQDVNTYLSFYSNKFKTPKGSRAKWRNTRHRALKANKNLSIQVSNIQTSQNQNIIELNFIQRFNSKKYSDIGIKELVWINDGSDWKILKETWMRS